MAIGSNSRRLSLEWDKDPVSVVGFSFIGFLIGLQVGLMFYVIWGLMTGQVILQ